MTTFFLILTLTEEWMGSSGIEPTWIEPNGIEPTGIEPTELNPQV